LPKDQIKNLFSKKEFRSINLASIPETLFESELIGIVKGSATGVKSKFGHLTRISERKYNRKLSGKIYITGLKL